MRNSKIFMRVVSFCLVAVFAFSGAVVSFAKEETDQNSAANTTSINQVQSLQITNALEQEGWIQGQSDNTIVFTEKYVNYLREKNPGSYVYTIENGIYVAGATNGGVDAFVYNEAHKRWELFMSHDKTVQIEDAISAGKDISAIIAAVVPVGDIVAAIASGVLTLGKLAFEVKDKGNGVVILLKAKYVPYWICTQA